MGWITIPFAERLSNSRDRTLVFCILEQVLNRLSHREILKILAVVEIRDTPAGLGLVQRLEPLGHTTTSE